MLVGAQPISMLINPTLIIVLSGKRKAGKDFIASRLADKIGRNQCDILHLSAPLKKQYADMHGLSYEELLSSSEYKETYRKSMILWGEHQREMDAFFFCKLCVQQASKAVWIVADARRPTDLEYFKSNFPNSSVFVRITASMQTRNSRGWKFVDGVDNVNSECALDEGFHWDVLLNNDNSEECEMELDRFLSVIKIRITS